MTAKTVDAVYENGVFRPVAKPPGIAEGQHVRLIVEAGLPEDVLALAASVYEGLTEEQIDEIERIALDHQVACLPPSESSWASPPDLDLPGAMPSRPQAGWACGRGTRDRSDENGSR